MTAIDLRRTKALEGLDVQFVLGDVTDSDSMLSALSGVDVVCHLAAVISVIGDPTGVVRRVNVEGPGAVADAALTTGVSRMIHCSSVHAYDLSRAIQPVTEDGLRSEAEDLPAYDRSKWAGEREVHRRVNAGLDAVVVNPTGIIGPYDFAPSRMGHVFRAIRDRRLPAVVDGGFDWVDARDVAEGISSAITQGRTGENYLLSGRRLDLKNLAEIAATQAGVAPPRLTLPSWLARAWGPIGTQLARRSNSTLPVTSESLRALLNGPEVSSTKATHELGYTARPIEDTVADIYAWFDSEGI